MGDPRGWFAKWLRSDVEPEAQTAWQRARSDTARKLEGPASLWISTGGAFLSGFLGYLAVRPGMSDVASGVAAGFAAVVGFWLPWVVALTWNWLRAPTRQREDARRTLAMEREDAARKASQPPAEARQLSLLEDRLRLQHFVPDHASAGRALIGDIREAYAAESLDLERATAQANAWLDKLQRALDLTEQSSHLSLPEVSFGVDHPSPERLIAIIEAACGDLDRLAANRNDVFWDAIQKVPGDGWPGA